MHFLSPAHLWLLGLVPVIVLLYLLKLRRREWRVSSTLLWEQLFRDMRANAPLQKLRKNLLLLLQILTIIALALALSRPFLEVQALARQSIVLVFDASASMKAADVRPSRFAVAQSAAHRMVEDLSVGDRMLIISAARTATVLSPFTTDKQALHRAIDRASAVDTRANLQDAILLAASLTQQAAHPVLYLLSDGAHTGELRAPEALPLRFVRCGQGHRNAGIVAMDVRRNVNRQQEYEVFVAVRNFDDRQRAIDLELLHRDRLLASRRLELAPHSERGQVFSNLPLEAGLLTARLDGGDDLAVDDIAYAHLRSQRAASVLLVSAGNPFLAKALQTLPAVETSLVAPGDYTPATAEYDLTVFDGVALPPPQHGGIVYLHCSGRLSPASVVRDVEGAEVVDWERRHPVLRYVNLSRLQLARASVLRPRTWGEVIAETADGPLIVAGQREGRRSIQIGFGLRDCDLPLRVSFPIMVSNLVQWAAGERAAEESLQVRTGEAAAVRPPAAARSLRLTFPSGRSETLPVTRRPLRIAATDEVGVYELSARGWRGTLAVSLLDADESDIAPAEQIRVGAHSVAADQGPIRTNREIWRLLALVALALLVVEWHFYTRGGW